ncbi:MAG: glycosyltransferase family 39 protein [Elusimicrobia bacterium]|nr:glycosyltransferase family 39 protein [Elusimicrobiota bacterium]
MEAVLPRRLALALILLASVLAHLKGLTSPMLDYHAHRQCNTISIARNYHDSGLEFFCPRISWEGGYEGCAATEFPLFMWLTGLFWSLFGLGEVWGRLLAALFSALTAVYLFRFLERRLGYEPAFYAGLLFSFVPLEVFFGRSVQPEALALLATIGAFFHWDRSLDEGRAWGHWLAAVAWVVIAVGSKLPYAYLLGVLLVLSWDKLGRKAFWDWRGYAAAGLALGTVFAWYKHASTGAYVVPTSSRDFKALLDYQGMPRYIKHQFLSRFPELTATYGGLALMAVGARVWFQEGKGLLLPLWWLAVAVHLVLGGFYAYHHEYTSLPFATVNAAFMGLGLATLRLKAAGLSGKARAWALAGVALLALSVPVHAALRIRHWYNLSFTFLLHAAQAADAVSAPSDLFMCNGRGPSVYLYYLKRRGWSWAVAEAGEARINEVEEKIAAGAKFYMTGKDPEYLDPGGFYHRYFFSRYPVVYDKDGILIFRVRPGAKPGDAAREGVRGRTKTPGS